MVENLIPFCALTGSSRRLADGETLQVSGLGGGVAYYLATSSVFVSLTATRAVMEVLAGGDRVTVSRPRFTVEGKLGKECWVSPNWGLGVGGAFLLGRIGVDGDPNAAWAVAGGALVFSATFN